MLAPLLELENLQKYFPVSTGVLLRRKIGWVKAVDGVDIAIYPGETLGLIGEFGVRQDDDLETDPAARDPDRRSDPVRRRGHLQPLKGRS